MNASGSRQREHYHFDARPQHQNVYGVFYIEGKRLRRKLASFADLGLEAVEIIGEDGQPKMGENDKPLMEARLIKAGARAEAALTRTLDVLHRDMERGLIQAGQLKKEKGESIRGLWNEWIDLNKNLKAKNTLYYYRTTRDEYLGAVGGDHPIAEGSGPLRKFSTRRGERFLAALKERKRPLADKSINIRIQVLNAFLRWAHDGDDLDKLTTIKQIKAAKKLPKTLNHDDIRAFLDRVQHLKENAPKNKRAAYEIHERVLMMGLGTGMRLSEMVFARWDQIDWKRNIIRVEMQTRFAVKEKREKTIALPAFLVSYLKKLQAGNIGMKWFLDDGAGQLAVSGPDVISLAFRRHFKALGFDKRGIKAVHGLRALYADELRKAGVDVWTIKESMGHSDIKVTQGYFSGTEENKRKAADSLKEFGETLTKPKSKKGKTRAG